MRRLFGLYKEYDIVELTDDVPESNLKRGDTGTIVSIGVGRGGASFYIELFDGYWDESEDSDEDQGRWLEVELFVQPPIKIIDLYFEDGTSGDSYNVFPDTRTFINIDLPKRVVE